MIKYLPMKEMMEQADIVSLHCPVTDKSKGLINKETLSYMKPTAFLINEARGPVVVSQDLADALNSGKIARCRHRRLLKTNRLSTPITRCSIPRTPSSRRTSLSLRQNPWRKRAVIVFDNIDAYLAGNQKNVIL